MENKKNQKYFCPTHKDYRIAYLQVRDIQRNKKNQSLFYCVQCTKADLNFNLNNYECFQEIIQSKPNEILTSWPPINEKQLLIQFKSSPISQQQINSLIEKSYEFFITLRKEVSKQIDECEKRMSTQIDDLKINEDEFIKEYLNLSRINDLKLIFDDTQTSIQEKEKQYQQLLLQVQSSIKYIESELSFQIHSNSNNTFDLNLANQAKESIFSSINNLTFFSAQQNKKYVIKNFYQIQKEENFLLTRQSYFYNILKNKNNELEIINEISLPISLIQDQTLEYDKKYVFRFSFQYIKDIQSWNIGLRYDNDNNLQYSKDILLQLNSQNEKISCKDFSKNFKQIQGQGFNLTSETILEMRVHLKEKIIQILDFPHYHNKLELLNDSKNLINNKNNYRLCIELKNKKSGIIVKEAYTI